MVHATLRCLSLTAVLTGVLGVAAAPEPRVDGNGDPLPDGAVARFGSMRLRHAMSIDSVAFSADGKQLVSVSNDDKAVRVWEIPSGKLLHRVPVGNDSQPHAAAFGADGIVLVSGETPLLAAEDVKKGRQLFARETEGIGVAVALAPDGKTVAVGLESGKTLLLDAATGAETAALDPEPMRGPVARITFAPDGKHLAIGHADGMVRLWNVAARKRLHTIPSDKGAEGVFFDVSFAPDGRSVALATDERLLQFAVETGKAVEGFEPPMEDLAGVRYSLDGKQLIGVGRTGRVFRWNARTGKQIAATKKELFPDGDERMAVFNPAATMAALVNDSDIHLLDLRTGKLLYDPAGPRTAYQQLRILSKGEVVCRGEDGSLRFFDPANGKAGRIERAFSADDPRPPILDLSPDGKRLAAVEENGSLRLLEGKKELWKLASADDGMPTSLSFGPDNTLLAVCYPGGVVLFDAATGKRRTALAVPGDGEMKAAWSRDGRMIVVANTSKEEVTVWETATGRKRRTLSVKEPAVAAFALDGRRLAVGGTGGMVQVFDLGADGATLELAVGAAELKALAFSPDGTRLAAAGGDTARLWDAAGKPLFTYRGHEGEVNDLAFAADGKTLLTVSQDGTALVWDAANPAHSLRPSERALTPAMLWNDLGSDDAERAFRAALRMRETPADAVAFLKLKLAVTRAPDMKRVERLIKDLDSDDFAARENATKELEGLDVQVEAALRAALAKNPSAEAKRWLRMLIDKAESPPSSPEHLRQMRAIEVLEKLAVPEARTLLQVLAAGGDSRLTRDARAALRRLERGE